MEIQEKPDPTKVPQVSVPDQQMLKVQNAMKAHRTDLILRTQRKILRIRWPHKKHTWVSAGRIWSWPFYPQLRLAVTL